MAFYTTKYQMQNCNFKCVISALLVSVILVGCASSKSDSGDSKLTFEALIKQADGELLKGKSEQSIALLNQAARKNPTSMVPWLKMANIWFNATNYPSAILSANEVLLRESENQEAKSILVVAGLRVAAGAITRLVPQNPVNPGARAEAENLTNELRKALGEKILVPVVAAEPVIPAAPRSPVHRHRVVTAPANQNVSTSATAPVASQRIDMNSRSATMNTSSISNVSDTGSNSSDPFKSLK